MYTVITCILQEKKKQNNKHTIKGEEQGHLLRFVKIQILNFYPRIISTYIHFPIYTLLFSSLNKLINKCNVQKLQIRVLNLTCILYSTY